ncbi:MAG TPA: glycosyltransferase [Polyangia bacterium]|nr:glycosyltransferase [Polyangia bacterium]
MPGAQGSPEVHPSSGVGSDYPERSSVRGEEIPHHSSFDVSAAQPRQIGYRQPVVHEGPSFRYCSEPASKAGPRLTQGNGASESLGDQMDLSIVIPTRLREETLARCLESLRPQLAEGSAEVIVTDDGTTEATHTLIESRFAFARWTRGPQRGPAANRNHGASLATGEFVVFLDDDVDPSPKLLAAYRAAIQPGVNVYEGRTTCRAGLRSPLEDSPVNEDGGRLWSCNLMLRRNLLNSVGGFDEAFPYPHLEDVAFRESLTALREQIVFVPDAVVDHPPRRQQSAKVLASHHESSFLYHYKYLGRAPSLAEFLTTFSRHRLGCIFSYRVGRDSAVALGSMGVELFHVLRNWQRWDRKWRGELRTRSTGACG